MGYALRHIGDLTAAFNEFFRVLRPGGLLCVLEITLPKGTLSRALLKGYMRGVVPWLAGTLFICLGGVAVRFPNEELKWNAANQKFPNKPQADQYTRREYRKGWEVQGLS